MLLLRQGCGLGQRKRFWLAEFNQCRSKPSEKAGRRTGMAKHSGRSSGIIYLDVSPYSHELREGNVLFFLYLALSPAGTQSPKALNILARSSFGLFPAATAAAGVSHNYSLIAQSSQTRRRRRGEKKQGLTNPPFRLTTFCPSKPFPPLRDRTSFSSSVS